MVKYLVDTDIIISSLNRKPAAIVLIKQFDFSSLSISSITYGETLEGVINTVKYDTVKKALQEFSIIKLDYIIAERFAYERKMLRQAGNLIDNMDLLIASTALVNNLTLITNNTKDFKKIKELKLFKNEK